MHFPSRFDLAGKVNHFLKQPLPWWEILLVTVLFLLVIRQLLSFPVTADPDPDGYVSYAQYVQTFGRLPVGHRRLPGYPLFITLVDRIGPGDAHHDVYWAQFGLAIAFVLTLWVIVRRYFGRIIGLIFLALYAAPNFQLFYSVIMLADFGQQVLWLLYLTVLLTYLQPNRKISHIPLLMLLAGLTFVSFVIHPGSRYISIFFLGSILALYGLHRLGFIPQGRLIVFNRQLWQKVGLALLLVIFITVGVERSPMGIGMHHFHRNWIAWRLCLCLPPATSTPLNQEIEAFKDRASAKLGYRVEYEAPNVLGDDQLNSAMLKLGLPSLPSQWDRVVRYPWKFLGCGFNELLLRYHAFAKQYFPFMSERRFVTISFLPMTDTPVSKLYRLTGIELQLTTTQDTWLQLGPRIAIAILQILIFYGLTVLGIVLLHQRFPILTIALTLTLIPYFGLLMLALPLEPRYLNPFAPFLYLGHAVAIFWLGQQLLKRFRQLA
jgi:hypothetical protein